MGQTKMIERLIAQRYFMAVSRFVRNITTRGYHGEF